MINQLEIPMYLEDAIPAMTNEFRAGNKPNAFALMTSLAQFTCTNVREHNYKTVKQCFKVADKLYSKGNGVVKNAVQNVFVYSLTRMFQCYPAEKKQILAMIPMTLFTLYVAQVCHKGC